MHPEELYRTIDKQVTFNAGRNFFHGENPDIFSLSESTMRSWELFRNIPGKEEEQMIGYATEKTIRELCRINQYYAFPFRTKSKLRKIYSRLLTGIRDGCPPDELIPLHYRQIRSWLLESNSFAKILYTGREAILDPVTCEEYSAVLQAKVLNLNISSLKEPVLDLGCGIKGSLVHFLRSRGIEAFGIERFTGTSPYIINHDWLEFDYGRNRWGTVISHLGFSNHFRHHHLRKDGNITGYSKTYMAILYGLKKGGVFYYAPDMPFIEKYLDHRKFRVSKYPIDRLPYQATHIQKIY